MIFTTEQEGRIREIVQEELAKAKLEAATDTTTSRKHDILGPQQLTYDIQNDR